MNKYFISILFLFIILLGCQKRYLRLVPVINIEKDMSLPRDSTITFVDFASDAVGLCSLKGDGVFRTEDGGNHWEALPDLSLYSCKGICFLDQNTGFVLHGSRFMLTTDAGKTWTKKPYYADALGIINDTVVVLAYLSSSGNSIEIQKSFNKGESFQDFDVYATGSYYDELDVSINNNYCTVANMESEIYPIVKINLENGEYQHQNYCGYGWDRISNTYFFNDIIYSIGPKGLLCINGEKSFANHDYPFYSIDGYEDRIIAVGEKTIVTNIYQSNPDVTYWDELYNDSLGTHYQTFNFVKVKNQNSAYIGGEKGLLWKIKL